MGAVSLLDQAPHYLCKATDVRYIYHCFDVLSVRILQHLLDHHGEWFTIAVWQVIGLRTEQIALRLLTLLAPLVHSEEISNQRRHIALMEHTPAEVESLTHMQDPYRTSFAKALKTYGFPIIFSCPQGGHVHVCDFVYWLIRYYTSHMAYVTHSCRSRFMRLTASLQLGAL